LQMAIVQVYFWHITISWFDQICVVFVLYLIFYWYFQNISADLDASKRRIQAAAERALGTAVNVVSSNV
jgi:hypothetical protein